jgi:hypothetical protein
MASRFLAGFAAMTLASAAFAGGPEQAGSLLVYPCYDNIRGMDTFITVTNTNLDVDNGTIKVEFVYIDGYNCLEFNRTRTLTPGDTLTVKTKTDNPNSTKGYVYVFAKNKTTGAATSFNHLIGTSRVTNGGSGSDLEIQPFVYTAAGAAGANTDLDNDGIRDLNGAEYEQSADQLFLPRFLGQGPAVSDLVMINLTGGSKFTATVDLLIWNDNEEVFSSQYSFDCWEKKELSEISGAFNQDFLLSTNHTVSESFGGIETGLFWINGLIASSTATSINNPAVLAVLIETLPGDYNEQFSYSGNSTAVLPYGKGTQDNGDLVPHSVLGDV